jgi:hypothetical protein
MNDYPELCFAVGLDCESCTAASARQLAQVCKGLRGKMIGQLFVQIHSHSACAKMHAHFTAAYVDASAGIARKEVGSETHRMVAAVA